MLHGNPELPSEIQGFWAGPELAHWGGMTQLTALKYRKSRSPLAALADALSLGNLLAGLASVHCAVQGQLSACLALLGLGALLDGLDGAAARRFGGSRFGVLADDLADAVSYGIAPAVAVSSQLGGVQGRTLGVAFALFVVCRLVFFTLNKAGSDPRYFAGVPSTIGGLIVLCSLMVFGTAPALVGFMIGVACAQMVAFSNPHRHLGRFLAEHPRTFRLVPVLIAGLVLVGLWRGASAGAGVLLAVSAVYGLWPSVKRFAKLVPAR